MTALVSMAPAAIARETIAHHSKSFALASRLLDERTRDQTAVVYTFCRRADDAVDLGADPRRALEGLRRELDDIFPSSSLISARAPADRVSAAFADIARERGIPRRYPDELLAGMAMDVDDTRYATLGQLRLYCHRVAGVVGLMMSHVFGVRDNDALVSAAQLGTAMQLTNICRDVAEDWDRGRLYIPDDLLAPAGAQGLAADLGGPLPGIAIAPLARAIRELLAMADRLYAAAARGIPALPWRAALAVRAASSIYRAIGTRIRRAGCDVTAGRAVVPARTKLALVAAAVARTVASLPHLAFAEPAAVPSRIVEVADVPFA